jgi:hypothetical protein
VNGRFRPISGNGPQARTGSQPHDRVDHNVKATFVAVRWGLDHGVGLRLLRPFGLRPQRVRWRQGRCSSFDAAFRVTKHVGTHRSLLRPLRLAAVARWVAGKSPA